jgi:hypothetical protein
MTAAAVKPGANRGGEEMLSLVFILMSLLGVAHPPVEPGRSEVIHETGTGV